MADVRVRIPDGWCWHGFSDLMQPRFKLHPHCAHFGPCWDGGGVGMLCVPCEQARLAEAAKAAADAVPS